MRDRHNLKDMPIYRVCRHRHYFTQVPLLFVRLSLWEMSSIWRGPLVPEAVHVSLAMGGAEPLLPQPEVEVVAGELGLSALARFRHFFASFRLVFESFGRVECLLSGSEEVLIIACTACQRANVGESRRVQTISRVGWSRR